MSKGLTDQVILSSRVRLARNYRDIPFPTMMNDEAAETSIRRAVKATESSLEGKSFRLLRMKELSPAQRQAMVEEHLISRDLLNAPQRKAVLINDGHTLSVMLNEEDHLRIQALLPGAQLEKAAALAREVDERIEKSVQYAFDEQLGYLTTCPTNTGSGMRASQMLHLPALTMAGQMGNIYQQIAKLGLTMRGLYGEGSEAKGNLYQVSNQVTLGRTEKEIVDAIDAVGEQLTQLEKKTREALYRREKVGLTDQLMRSLGILRFAQRVDSQEFMQRWSDVRLAALMGLVEVPLERLDGLLTRCQPASIIGAAGQQLTTQARDEARASILRRALDGVVQITPTPKTDEEQIQKTEE